MPNAAMKEKLDGKNYCRYRVEIFTLFKCYFTSIITAAIWLQIVEELASLNSHSHMHSTEAGGPMEPSIIVPLKGSTHQHSISL